MTDLKSPSSQLRTFAKRIAAYAIGFAIGSFSVITFAVGAIGFIKMPGDLQITSAIFAGCAMIAASIVLRKGEYFSARCLHAPTMPDLHVSYQFCDDKFRFSFGCITIRQRYEPDTVQEVENLRIFIQDELKGQGIASPNVEILWWRELGQ